MEFTPRELTHILAALRTCQQRGLNKDWHFDETEPLSDPETDSLCERLNAPDLDTGTDKEFTVVGLYPDSEWNSSMRDASFVEHVRARTPAGAADQARRKTARSYLSSQGNTDEDVPESGVSEMAGNIEILAVFEGALQDLHDPESASPSD